ncbi:MAG TPA: DUF4846 domain-containing protein, partial [Polyangiaceae bacterium]|nr:DUF4846 domain-containing protein [Polyangiaceae bacterium]
PASDAADAAPSDVEPRPPTAAEREAYAWLGDDARVRPLDRAIAAPPGFHRVPEEPESFGAWLRSLPLRPAGSPVRSYDGEVLHAGDDPRIAAVVEVDVSPVDLQQCADSVIRMHAEWQWATGRKAEIGYHFLSGDYAKYADYAAGDRPVVDGQHVRFARSARASDDHATFRKYLDLVFTYASTISVAQRGEKIAKEALAPGDFIVLPGGPGHAILILDVAVDDAGHRVALLGQGYMPAQDFQVLHARPGDGNRGAWFSLDGDAIDTPFWPVPFPWSSLRRMRG